MLAKELIPNFSSSANYSGILVQIVPLVKNLSSGEEKSSIFVLGVESTSFVQFY